MKKLLFITIPIFISTFSPIGLSTIIPCPDTMFCSAADGQYHCTDTYGNPIPARWHIFNAPPQAYTGLDYYEMGGESWQRNSSKPVICNYYNRVGHQYDVNITITSGYPMLYPWRPHDPTTYWDMDPSGNQAGCDIRKTSQCPLTDDPNS